MARSEIAGRPGPSRFDGVGAGLFGSGLLLWYLGGSAALDRMVDPMRLVFPVVLGALVVAAGVGLAARGAERGVRLRSTIAFAFAGGAILLWGLVPLANQLADRSAPLTAVGAVVGVQERSKGPDVVTIGLDEPRLELGLAAHRAPGCAAGDVVGVELGRGAAGWWWVRSARCD